MASQGSSTRVQAPPPPPRRTELELSTLVLSAIASAAAAYVTARLWAPGTLFSAAMTPVIVALVKEGLRRPAEVVTASVPAQRRRARPLPADLPERLDAGAAPPYPPPQPGAAEGPVRIYSTRGRRLRWRLALLTGVLGFVACVVLYTVPELIAGGSVGRPGHETTLWGGKRSTSSSSSPATTSTTSTSTSTQETTTPSTTETKPPVRTVTQTVTTPAPAPAPADAQPSSAAPPAAAAPQQGSTATPASP